MMKHKNNNKRTVVLAGLVVTLVVLAGVAFASSDTSDLEGRLMGASGGHTTDAQSQDMGHLLGECGDDICDVMDAVEDLHDEVGYSSWTLEQLAVKMTDNMMYMRDVVWDDNSMFVSLYDDVDDVYNLVDATSGSLEDQLNVNLNLLQDIRSKAHAIYAEVSEPTGYTNTYLDVVHSKVNDVHGELTNSTSDLWEALDEMQMKIDYIIANM